MQSREKSIDFDNLGFSFIETNVMFVSDYKEGGWDEGKILPLGPIELSPAACVLNYGQGIFEGLKALRTKNGEITLFRPKENGKRLNRSAERLMMPSYDVNKLVGNMLDIVNANKGFIPPYESGGSLYIRPLMIGSSPKLGIAPAKEYKLIIYTSPVGPYFPEGFKANNLEISMKYTRSSPGGTGFSKTCSNYAGTMKPTNEAHKRGYSQILYLDSVHMKYISEVGSANFCAVIDDILTTPKLDGTIFEGITLNSVMKIAEKKLGMKVEERDISYEELFTDSCTETFCTGTAAVITPIGSVELSGNTRVFNNKTPGAITSKLYELLTGIQRNDLEDPFNWIVKVK